MAEVAELPCPDASAFPCTAHLEHRVGDTFGVAAEIVGRMEPAVVC